MSATGVLLGGVAQGGEYALVVLGFVLTWGATRVVNLAQGSVAVAGAYLAWQVHAALGVPALLAVALATALLMALGYVTGYLAMPALRGRPSFWVLVITFGAGLVVQGLLVLRYGNGRRMVPSPLTVAGVSSGTVGAVLMSMAVILICAAGCMWGVVLWQALPGRVMAMVGGDRETARTLGIRPQRIEALGLALGAACAAAGGGLSGITGAFQPSDASHYTLVCAVVAITVGVGSLVRSMEVAVGLGVAGTVARHLFGSGPTTVAAIILLLVVLAARAAGFHHHDEMPGERGELAR